MSGSRFLESLKSNFNYHMEDSYDNYLLDVFSEFAGSKDLAKSFVKSLKKVEFKTDIDDIRLPTDEDFNPGPFILIGVPVSIGDQSFSLIPGLVGLGQGNTSALMGVVCQGEGFPDHALGYRIYDRDGITIFDFEVLREQTDQFYGKFIPPKELKGFRVELTQPILTTFLGYLAYGFGSAILASGIDGFDDAKNQLESFLDGLWSEFLKDLEKSIEDLD